MRAVIQHVAGRHDGLVEDMIKILSYANWKVHVELDEDHDPMGCFARSLIAEPHWHFEDDIFLAPDFVSRAREEVIQRSYKILRGFCQKATQVGDRAGSSFAWTQCVWFPGGYGPQIAAYIPTWKRLKEHPTGFDYVIADWLKERKEGYHSIQPALCQHVIGPTGLGGTRARRRVSESFNETYPDYAI